MKVTINERDYELKELTKEQAKEYIGEEVYVWDCDVKAPIKAKLLEVYELLCEHPFCVLSSCGIATCSFMFCAPIPEEWYVFDLGKVVKGNRYHTTTTPSNFGVVDHGSEEYCRQKAEELNAQEEKTKRPCTREELIEMLKKQGLPMLLCRDNEFTYSIIRLNNEEITVMSVLGSPLSYDYRDLCNTFTLLDGTKLWVVEAE